MHLIDSFIYIFQQKNKRLEQVIKAKFCFHCVASARHPLVKVLLPKVQLEKRTRGGAICSQTFPLYETGFRNKTRGT